MVPWWAGSLDETDQQPRHTLKQRENANVDTFIGPAVLVPLMNIFPAAWLGLLTFVAYVFGVMCVRRLEWARLSLWLNAFFWSSGLVGGLGLGVMWLFVPNADGGAQWVLDSSRTIPWMLAFSAAGLPGFLASQPLVMMSWIRYLAGWLMIPRADFNFPIPDYVCSTYQGLPHPTRGLGADRTAWLLFAVLSPPIAAVFVGLNAFIAFGAAYLGVVPVLLFQAILVEPRLVPHCAVRVLTEEEMEKRATAKAYAEAARIPQLRTYIAMIEAQKTNVILSGNVEAVVAFEKKIESSKKELADLEAKLGVSSSPLAPVEVAPVEVVVKKEEERKKSTDDSNGFSGVNGNPSSSDEPFSW